MATHTLDFEIVDDEPDWTAELIELKSALFERVGVIAVITLMMVLAVFHDF